MRGESMKGKSKKSTYSTTFGVDPKKSTYSTTFGIDPKNQPIPQPLVLTPIKPLIMVEPMRFELTTSRVRF